ncbi:DUF2182 domain-containing protein [Rhodococcus sp. 14C212]|uniref:copper chaperone n=1 Tax=Rhodococcus sp. 14C212 TaxID=2711209 RepID=UPI0013E9D2B8|nr:DUF2182 domain-containing protein [Rhodococcus sp. 14C212]
MPVTASGRGSTAASGGPIGRGRHRTARPDPHRRTPLTFLATHDFGTGWWGTVRAGASHGLYCPGCCRALRAVLFVVGLMNLTWMAAIAVILVAEKNSRHGVMLTKVVGAAVIVLGLAVLVHPSLLQSLAPSPPAPPPMSGM